MNKLIQEIIKHKKTCYFVSPHLDDAAFSAGGLISYLANKTKVVVVTAFTHAGENNHSLSALAYARKCDYKKNEVTKFFADRRKEDRELFKSIGVEVSHLGFYAALWREKKNLNIIYKFMSLFLNEFRYVYPTHRLHVSKGKIHDGDRKNVRKLERKLEEVVGNEKNCVIICPLGIGKHVDHIVVREICTKIFPNAIYWEDSPYNLYHELDEDLIKKNNLRKQFFRKNQSIRKDMYPAYKTQFGKLFGGKTDFSLPPEVYYLKL